MGIIKYRTDASSPWMEIAALQGRTPVKGVDYFTEQDIEEVVQEVSARIDVPDVPDVDFTGYATEEYVDEAIASVPHYDLTGYATKSYVVDKIDAIPKYDMSAYALKSHKHDEYALQSNMGAYALKKDIPTVPDVSAFQTAAQVKALIDASLGVIENGAY